MMDFLDKLREALDGYIEIENIRGDDCGVAFFKLNLTVDEVKNIIKKVFEGLGEKGELIYVSIKDGEFIDMGRRSLLIKDGYIFEWYDYEELMHLYIRIYEISDVSKSWVSLYLDWSLKSHWWE